MTHHTSPFRSNEPLLVAFCGGKGHGKGTAAEVLVRKYDFFQIEFADGLRQTVATALRCPASWFTDPSTKEEIDPRTGKSRRFWLQWIGTEGFRALYDNIWIDWWKGEIADQHRVAAQARQTFNVVTTDLRFPNELDAVRGFGHRAVVIRITNPRLPVVADGHASESFYRTFDVDYDVANTGTVHELQKQIENILSERFPESMRSAAR